MWTVFGKLSVCIHVDREVLLQIQLVLMVEPLYYRVMVSWTDLPRQPRAQQLRARNGAPISPVASSPIQYVAGSNSYNLSFTVPAGFSNSGQTITCSGTATGQIATDDFDFVSGEYDGSTTNFPNATGVLENVSNSGGAVTLNFSRSDNVAQSDFTLPTWVNWASNNPLTYDSGTDSGELNLVVDPTSSARNGNVAYDGIIDVGMTGTVTIQQSGTVVNPQGELQN